MFRQGMVALVGTVAIGLSFAGSAEAASFSEVGDAGNTFDTAQEVDISVESIVGAITEVPDDLGDIFTINWGGGLFTASTVGTTFFDTELFLWDADGNLIAENDDFGPPQSQVTADLLAGTYFIGVSGWNTFATPDGIGDDNNFRTTGTYEITFNAPTAASADVPEPASTLAVLAVGTVAAGALKKKQVA